MKILLAVITGLFMLGCGDDAKEETQAKQEVQTTKELKQEQVAEPEIVTGESLYKRCVSCHGADASKKALGKSKVIKGWSVEKLTSAIEGYKNGTYGGEMKVMMQNQVRDLNAVDINILSNYISKL